MDYPTLGDPSKTYTVELTEPEINAIHAATGYFIGHEMAFRLVKPSELLVEFIERYLPVMKALSDKLAKFDDVPS